MQAIVLFSEWVCGRARCTLCCTCQRLGLTRRYFLYASFIIFLIYLFSCVSESVLKWTSLLFPPHQDICNDCRDFICLTCQTSGNLNFLGTEPTFLKLLLLTTTGPCIKVKVIKLKVWVYGNQVIQMRSCPSYQCQSANVPMQFRCLTISKLETRFHKEEQI